MAKDLAVVAGCSPFAVYTADRSRRRGLLSTLLVAMVSPARVSLLAFVLSVLDTEMDSYSAPCLSSIGIVNASSVNTVRPSTNITLMSTISTTKTA